MTLAPVFSHPHSRYEPQGPPVEETHMAELVGNLLDALGVEHHPEEGELVASAVVLLKVIGADGDVSLRTLSSDGLSWIEKLGMLRAAEAVELPSVYEIPGE